MGPDYLTDRLYPVIGSYSFFIGVCSLLMVKLCHLAESISYH